MDDKPAEKTGEDKTDELLRKLVQVPKKELVKERRKRKRCEKKK